MFKYIFPAVIASLMGVAPGSSIAQGQTNKAATPHWTRAADASLARQELYPVAMNEKIYVAGGILTPATGYSAHFEAYDVKQDRWDTLTPLPEGRHHIALAQADGRIYGVGGFSGGFPFWRIHSSVFVYDPRSNQWSNGPSLPEARAEGVVMAVHNKIYSIGGRIASKPDATHFHDYEDTARSDVLDPSSNSWHRIADAPSTRNSAAGAVIDDKIYVVGGRQAIRQADGSLRQVNVPTLEVYDPVANRWDVRSPMPQAQGGLAAAAHGGKLYVFGGEQWVPEEKVFADAWVYDPDTDAWAALPALPTPRHGLGAAAVGNRIFLVGGAEQPGGAATSKLNEVLELPPLL